VTLSQINSFVKCIGASGHHIVPEGIFLVRSVMLVCSERPLEFLDVHYFVHVYLGYITSG